MNESMNIYKYFSGVISLAVCKISAGGRQFCPRGWTSAAWWARGVPRDAAACATWLTNAANGACPRLAGKKPRDLASELLVPRLICSPREPPAPKSPGSGTLNLALTEPRLIG